MKPPSVAPEPETALWLPTNENTPPDNGATNASVGLQLNYLNTMIAQPTSTKQLSADGFTWNQYSDRVATITNETTHFAPVCYFQFPDWDAAHRFWKGITDKRLGSRAQVREAERFDSGWEVKVWGMSDPTLLKLIERDRTRTRTLPLPLPPIRRDWPMAESYSAIQHEAA